MSDVTIHAVPAQAWASAPPAEVHIVNFAAFFITPSKYEAYLPQPEPGLHHHDVGHTVIALRPSGDLPHVGNIRVGLPGTEIVLVGALIVVVVLGKVRSIFVARL
jgi:hypothetical protein